MLRNKCLGMGPKTLKFGRQRKTKNDVGARLWSNMKVCLFSDLCAQGIDDEQSPTSPFRGPDVAHKMEVRDGRVITPNDIEFGSRRNFWPDPGSHAIGASPGFIAHEAAQ